MFPAPGQIPGVMNKPVLVQYVLVVVRTNSSNAAVQVDCLPEKPDYRSIDSQTTNRAPVVPVIHQTLTTVANRVSTDFPHLQTRCTRWGRFQESCALEISRIKADVPPVTGGPMTVATVHVFDTGEGCLNIAGEAKSPVIVFTGEEINEPTSLKSSATKIFHIRFRCSK